MRQGKAGGQTAGRQKSCTPPPVCSSSSNIEQKNKNTLKNTYMRSVCRRVGSSRRKGGRGSDAPLFHWKGERNYYKIQDGGGGHTDVGGGEGGGSPTKE